MASNFILGAIGRRGSGKSTCVRQIAAYCPRLAILDICAEHDWVPNRIRPADWPRFIAWSLSRSHFAGAMVPDQLDQDVPLFADSVFDRGDLVIVLEELPMYSQPQYLPAELDKIIRLGRHRAVSVIWTAQRAAEVPRRVTAATDAFILFRQTEPRDLDAIAERCGKPLSDRVASLGRHEYLVWDVLGDTDTTLDATIQHLVALYH